MVSELLVLKAAVLDENGAAAVEAVEEKEEVFVDAVHYVFASLQWFVRAPLVQQCLSDGVVVDRARMHSQRLVRRLDPVQPSADPFCADSVVTFPIICLVIAL